MRPSLRLSPSDVQQLTQLLDDVVYLDSDADDGAPSLSEMAQRAGRLKEHLIRPVHGPSSAFKGPRRSAEKRAAKRGKSVQRREIREAIMARDRICTAGEGLGQHSGSLEWDHQWGRGKGCPPESAENGRALCGRHHNMKHGAHPSRMAWLRDFRRHAERYGYAAEVAKCDRAIALERAQHPE